VPPDPESSYNTLSVGAAVGSVEVPTFTLKVVRGPDAGKTLAIDGAQPGRVLLGTSPSCELRLSDPHVSRRHVALEVEPRGLRVTDLASTNHTFVNDLAWLDGYLGGGERLRLGETLLQVDRGATSSVPIATEASFGRTIGESAEMRRLYPMLRRVATSDVPVVIEGETGTGKEVLAESIHEEGPRAAKPFIVFDCTAHPASLIESALFGHERGAFTGATELRKGVFEQADQGTLFIDEIGDLELGLQAKLLRALERREVRRLGGDRWIKVDARILAATRRDLDREVATGRFRDDLFYRIAVARIELPPLRKRTGDVSVLARHLWRTSGGRGEIDQALLDRYEAYGWPGNVRELHNTIARHVALGATDDVGAARPGSGAPPPSAPPSALDAMEQILARNLPFVQARDQAMAEFRRRYVSRALAASGGNVARAAATSGIARRYFSLIMSRDKSKG
jgi:transcriptional regulator with GAF, ATPase, and Fis domain